MTALAFICTKTGQKKHCQKEYCGHAQHHERRFSANTPQADCWNSPCKYGGICVPLNIVTIKDERPA